MEFGFRRTFGWSMGPFIDHKRLLEALAMVRNQPMNATVLIVQSDRNRSVQYVGGYFGIAPRPPYRSLP